MLTHIDLFSGIGGFALAARWASFTTLAFVEIEPYAQEIIKQNFGAVENAPTERLEGRCNRGERIAPQSKRLFSAGSGEPRIYSDIRTFDGTAYRGATLLTGGFPCQPFSQAGKRRGTQDDRYLWPEMLRVIHDARPTWVLGENVAGIVNMELDRVLSDLEGEGYAVQALVIPACAVDAKHRRDRVWIVAHAEHGRDGKGIAERSSRAHAAIAGLSGEDVADDGGDSEWRAAWFGWRKRQQAQASRDGGRGTRQADGQWLAEPDVGLLADGVSADMVRQGGFSQWPQEPEIPRVTTGVQNRVDRLKGLGNAIVPQVAYEIIKGIADIENATLR